MNTNEPGVSPHSLMDAWHVVDAEATARRLQVNPIQGLNVNQVTERTAAYGANEITEARRRSPLRMFLDQFADFMIIVLIAAGVIAGIIGEPQDTIAIVVIVVLNAVLGFVQEYRAERAMAALKQLAAPSARVRRAGQISALAARELVPGDVVMLEAGNVVPADLRLIEVAQLRVGEAALTGESQPVEKQAASLRDPELPVGDRRNMAYKGTLVTYGRATGLVVATGMATELGKIAALLHEEEPARTPLQKRLTSFGQRLAIVVLVICVIIFAVGMMRGEPPMLMFLTAVSLAVAAIPEALPAVVTISLALGARKMVKKNALIRRLPAVETLGSVTYICSDKTGTLTQNKMHAETFFVDGHLFARGEVQAAESPALESLLRAVALNNDAIRDDHGHLAGDPTEIALYEAAAAAGYEGATLAASAPRIAEIPFDSERRCMTTLHRSAPDSRAHEAGKAEGFIAYTKGAPESVLSRCVTPSTHGGQESDQARRAVTAAEQMASQGARVLAVARRAWPELPRDLDPETVERDLTLLGLVGLIDPPRPEAREAVSLCQSAGITAVMVTGDHPATARAIAQRVGIVADEATVLTGPELAQLSSEQLFDAVADVRVYARVAPAQKIWIVKALQDKGEFVAMTGDGVNDAPALKRADIGVAMGRIGTDVAREAADMVLLDDNFATIVTAVREGRRIFDNIRKFIKYTMSTNSAEVLTLFLAPFLLLPLPLLPIHILWINLVTDGLPGLAFAVEPEEKNLMQRPPRPPQESIFAHGMWQHMLWVGLLMAGVTLLAQAWAYYGGSAHWQSMVFTVLTLSQMGHALAIRSERESLARQGLLSNLPLLGAVLLTFALQMAVLYVPALQAVFKTAPLSAGELLLCLLLSPVVFIAVEFEKWMRRRGWIYRDGERNITGRRVPARGTTTATGGTP